MKYDVFLVSAQDDQALAELVVRRLRSLKFKVRYDRKRSHTTPAPRDTRDINNSQSVVVLWSEAACDAANAESDWVHAMAHTARARKDVLLQIGLDDTVPDDPFHLDERYMIKGMTSRTTPEDFYLFVEELEGRAGRRNLREWLMIPTKDRDAQDAWRNRHPGDPLSIKGDPVGVKKAAPAPVPVPEPTPEPPPPAALSPQPYVKPPVTSGAAALAAASAAQSPQVASPSEPQTPPPQASQPQTPPPQTPTEPVPPPLAPPVPEARPVPQPIEQPAAPAVAARSEETASGGAVGAIGAGTAAVAGAGAAAAAPATPIGPAATRYAYDDAADVPTSNPVWWILALIAVLFLFAFLWRSLQAPRFSGLPAVANSVRYAVCPAGTAHRSLFTDDYLATLEAGPIVNDTSQ
ncbi:MAG: TIR domain-containing protein [Pseudomonadota bacterium]